LKLFTPRFDACVRRCARLEEDKRDLDERLALLAQELERMRVKVTGSNRTS
jgi:hypothetical protein